MVSPVHYLWGLLDGMVWIFTIPVLQMRKQAQRGNVTSFPKITQLSTVEGRFKTEDSLPLVQVSVLHTCLACVTFEEMSIVERTVLRVKNLR